MRKAIYVGIQLRFKAQTCLHGIWAQNKQFKVEGTKTMREREITWAHNKYKFGLGASDASFLQSNEGLKIKSSYQNPFDKALNQNKGRQKS